MEISRRDVLKATGAVPLAQSARAANDRIQIGVIGCGARSHELMRWTMLHPQGKITHVTDAYSGRVERAMARTGARAAKDYREILADKSIDAVIVATPDHWHRAMVVEAVRAGKDVYCEKPLTYHAGEGMDIVRAAKETGRIVQVGSQGVSSEMQRRARELIREGKLGKVTMIRAAYNRNTASGAWIYPIPPDASPATVDWDAFLGSAKKRPFDLARFFRWRCYEDYSGGIATDLFVHLCTTIHFLMDAKMPARAVAMGQLFRWKDSRDVPDTLNAVLEYPEGFAVNLSSTFNNQLSAEGSFQILGTEGSLEIGDSLRFFPETAVDDNRWIVESWPEKLEQAYYRDPKVRASELPGSGAPKLKSGAMEFRQTGLDSTHSHLGSFLDGVRTRKAHWEDALIGHRAASCAHMVNLSAKERRFTEWDLTSENIRKA